MSRVLKAADPELAKTVSRCDEADGRCTAQFTDRSCPTSFARATPLPFFALSWLLTLFAHDVDSEPVIQLVFDFLLAHNPIMGVYLTVAVRALIRPSFLTTGGLNGSRLPGRRLSSRKRRLFTNSGRVCVTTPACSTRPSRPYPSFSRAHPRRLPPAGDARRPKRTICLPLCTISRRLPSLRSLPQPRLSSRAILQPRPRSASASSWARRASC